MKNCLYCKRSFEKSDFIKFCSILCKLKNKVKSNENGCWILRNFREGKSRYKYVLYEKKLWYVHRLFYHTMIESLNSHDHIFSICRKIGCCNPKHFRKCSKEEFCINSTFMFEGKRNITANMIIKILDLNGQGMTPTEIETFYNQQYKFLV